MPRPILATIHPRALAHNLAIASRLSPSSFVWAVVKANAYGHGIERIWAGLQTADGLAMLDFAEAARVRALGWNKPILMLEGCFDAADIRSCAELNLTPVVHSAHQLALHRATPLPLTVYVKVNSGMNRLGFALNDLCAMPAQALLDMPHIKIGMWMTHFANADVAGGAVKPAAAFDDAMRRLFAQHPRLQAPVSTHNSAAISGVISSDITQTAANLAPAQGGSVRAGIVLYGSSPFADRSAAQLGLQPAMTLTSQVIGIQQLAAGDTVGYGSTFTADSRMRVGIVACGYADGYPRHAPTGTPIAVAGVLTRIVGRVSMDMLAVDLSPVPNAAIGSAVELWGKQVPIDTVAQWAGTIAYELMCALAPRVPVRVEA